MSEVLKKIRALKTLGVHAWALASIALAKQQEAGFRLGSPHRSMAAASGRA
jgi:hypothetical protein